MRDFSLPAGALTLALAWAGAACGDPLTPEATEVEQGLVLSEVIETGSAQIVYVSLRAGTVPGGVSATATNLRTEASIQAAMVDGGFDPIALPAMDGDSIEVETRDREGDSRRFGGTAHLSRPPVVVRTGPGRGATDVGLNSIVVVVFSEPMDEQTISPETIGLTLDGEAVPVEVVLTPDGLGVEVRPNGLWPSREYTIVVGAGVRDGEGLHLEKEFLSTFRTLNAPTVATVTIFAESLSVEVGQPFPLVVTLRDAAGTVLHDRRVIWTAASPATLGPSGVARMMAPGEARISASAEGVTDSITVRAAPLRFQRVSAGDNHTCAVTVAGFAYCWGLNSWGQLGVGDTAARSLPTAVSGGLSLRSVAAGGRSTCALDSGNEAYCWGEKEVDPFYPVVLPLVPGTLPVPLASDLRFQELSLGRWHGCGVELSGTTLCWGLLFSDVIDPGTPEDPQGFYLSYPNEVVADPRLSSLTIGDLHSCGIAPDGKGICWGVNILGQLGDGTLRNATVWTEVGLNEWIFDPQTTTVDSDIPFSLIASGSTHTCALDAVGRAHCWGDNRGGQLGTGSANECFWSDITGPYDCRIRPAPVLGSMAFRSLSAGSRFTCGITTQGTAYCWGQNAHGELGNGSRAEAAAPSPVGGGLLFASISVGADHACGLTADGLLYCWGRGLEGQLGIGQTSDALLPVLVAMQVAPDAVARLSVPGPQGAPTK